MIDTSFLQELERFTLIVRKRVTSKYEGERKSLYSGSGTIFRDHRQYAVGDNIKAVDWNVYARTDDLYIKVYEEERNLDVHILLDASASMGYEEKFDYAGKLALGMAYIALKNNERVHFASLTEGINVLRGKRGRQQIMTMLTQFNSIKPKGKLPLAATLKQYMRYLHSKSLIIIVSDFLYPIEEIAEALAVIPRGHKVKLIQVLDEEERYMLLNGDFTLIDSETEEKLRTYVSPRSQQEYVNTLEKHVAEIKHLVHKNRWSFHQASSDKPVFDSFYEITRNESF